MNSFFFWYIVNAAVHGEVVRLHIIPREQKMNAFRKTVFTLIILLIPAFLLGNQSQVKIIKSEDDLPEKFCTIWKKGDHLIFNGQNLAIIGGIRRYLKSTTNYPAADAKGCILSLAPAGQNLTSDLIAGAPVIRFSDKKVELLYSSIKQVQESVPEGILTFEATAVYNGKKGKKAKVQKDTKLLGDALAQAKEKVSTQSKAIAKMFITYHPGHEDSLDAASRIFSF